MYSYYLSSASLIYLSLVWGPLVLGECFIEVKPVLFILILTTTQWGSFCCFHFKVRTLGFLSMLGFSRGWQMFSIKDRSINILGSVDRTVPVAATELWYCSTKADRDSTWVSKRSCFSVKLCGYCNWNFIFSCSCNIIHLILFHSLKTVNCVARRLPQNRWWARARPRVTVPRPLAHAASKLWSQILKWCLADPQVQRFPVTSGFSKKWGTGVLLSLVLCLFNSKINRNSNIWRRGNL